MRQPALTEAYVSIEWQAMATGAGLGEWYEREWLDLDPSKASVLAHEQALKFLRAPLSDEVRSSACREFVLW